MNIIRVPAIIAAVALFAASPSSVAAPSCTEWMLQDDGSYFRTCVDDNGNQYCERLKDGVITRISCSS